MRRKGVPGSAIFNKPATGTIHKNLKFKAIKLHEFKAIRNSEVYCEATNEVGRDKRKMKILVKRK